MAISELVRWVLTVPAAWSSSASVCLEQVAGAQAAQGRGATPTWASRSPAASRGRRCAEDARRAGDRRRGLPRAPPSEQDCRPDASARRVPPLLPPPGRARRLGGAHRVHRIRGGRPFCHGTPPSTSTASASPCAGSVFRHRQPLGSRRPHGAARYHWLCAWCFAGGPFGRRPRAICNPSGRACSGCATFSWRSRRPVRAEAAGPRRRARPPCAGVDIQIGVNVVARDRPSPAQAERRCRPPGRAAGRRLAISRDDKGRPSSCFQPGAGAVSAEGMRSMTTQGVTLTPDVPPRGRRRAVFERMMALAQRARRCPRRPWWTKPLAPRRQGGA